MGLCGRRWPEGGALPGQPCTDAWTKDWETYPEQCAQNINKVKFPFKRKVLPSHPCCNHLRQWIKLSLNVHFPMHWDWLKWFQFRKKKMKVLTLLNLLPLLSYDAIFDQFMTIKTFFQIDLHIMCTSGCIFVCKFWEAYLVFFMTVFAAVLDHHRLVFVD